MIPPGSACWIRCGVSPPLVHQRITAGRRCIAPLLRDKKDCFVEQHFVRLLRHRRLSSAGSFPLVLPAKAGIQWFFRQKALDSSLRWTDDCLGYRKKMLLRMTRSRFGNAVMHSCSCYTHRRIPRAALYPSRSGVALRRTQGTLAKIEAAQQQFRREM
jgi:hypothetical protein